MSEISVCALGNIQDHKFYEVDVSSIAWSVLFNAKLYNDTNFLENIQHMYPLLHGIVGDLLSHSFHGIFAISI